jgi:hypothetical protein
MKQRVKQDSLAHHLLMAEWRLFHDLGLLVQYRVLMMYVSITVLYMYFIYLFIYTNMFQPANNVFIGLYQANKTSEPGGNWLWHDTITGKNYPWMFNSSVGWGVGEPDVRLMIYFETSNANICCFRTAAVITTKSGQQ